MPLTGLTNCSGYKSRCWIGQLIVKMDTPGIFPLERFRGIAKVTFATEPGKVATSYVSSPGVWAESVEDA